MRQLNRRSFLILLSAVAGALRFGRASHAEDIWLTDDLYPVPRATLAVERACRVARSRVRPMRIVRWPSSSSTPAVSSPALGDLSSRSQRFATDGLAGVKG